MGWHVFSPFSSSVRVLKFACRCVNRKPTHIIFLPSLAAFRVLCLFFTFESLIICLSVVLLQLNLMGDFSHFCIFRLGKISTLISKITYPFIRISLLLLVFQYIKKKNVLLMLSPKLHKYFFVHLNCFFPPQLVYFQMLNWADHFIWSVLLLLVLYWAINIHSLYFSFLKGVYSFHLKIRIMGLKGETDSIHFFTDPEGGPH